MAAARTIARVHVKKGDTVVVIAGNDKGTSGEVRRVDRARNRVVVAGVNMRWKHRKPTQKSPKGERVQEERSIHASNVKRVDPTKVKRERKRGKKEAS
jgi:large subunit ribosomal protein L24